MKVRNKKGLTLIELIIAIAILAISMLAITSILTYSVNSESRSSVKLDTSSYAKAIIELSKTQPIASFTGKLSLSSPYKYYVYFNNMDELRNNLNNSYFGSVSSENVKSTSIGNFNDCKANNSNNKQYAVYISMANDTSTDYLENSLFDFEISVWNLSRDSSIVTHREFSISR